MGPRRKAALMRQTAFHEGRIRSASTTLDRLRAACSFLVAESKRGGMDAMRDDTEAVLALVAARRKTNLAPPEEVAA